jgi:chromosome segregation ATPase
MAAGPCPEWRVILEKIESEPLTIEAVEMNRVAVGPIDDLSTTWRIAGILNGDGDRGRPVRGRTHVDGLDSRMGSLEARFVAREEVVDRRLSLIEAALERIDRESRARDAAFEVAIRELRVSVQEIGAEVHELRTKVQENSAAIRDLSARLEALSRLEERVTALEKRTA